LLVGGFEDVGEERRAIQFNDETGPERVGVLKELGVDAVICGAISRPMACMLVGSGIEVFPQVSGEIDEVLGDYRAGRLCSVEFFSGCIGGGRRGRGRMRKGRGRGGGRGRGRGRRQA
jgi:predicted Fe-Mo cluster-binding NifX family protein